MLRIVLVILILLFTSMVWWDKKTPRLNKELLFAREAVRTKGSYQVIVDNTYDSSLLIARHAEEIRQEKSRPVYILRNESEEQLAYNAIANLRPVLDPDKPVLIKPNLGGFIGLKKGQDNGVAGRTTSPGFIKGIIVYLQEHGVKDIAIGESWGVTDPRQVQELFAISGYKELAETMKIKLLDLNCYNELNSDNIPVKVRYPEAKVLKDDIYVSKTYLRYLTEGIVINVPKLKTHRFTVTSLSLKNMMGVLMMQGKSPYMHANKSQMHPEINSWFLQKNLASREKVKKYRDSYQLFSERLADVYAVTKPDFSIIEGYYGTEGDGFDKIQLRKEQIAFASYNQIYADYAASAYMGFVNSDYLQKNFGFDVPLYLTTSFARFYPGINEMEDIKTIGLENIAPDQKPFWYIPMLKPTGEKD